jgi:hypothetical protein
MMITSGAKTLSLTLCFVLVVVSMPPETVGQDPNTPAYSGQGAPLTAEELQGLVAPIALYPDALVAQILAASTFPDQVGVADYWLQQNKNLTGTALMQAVDTQSWDPSVKALAVPIGAR